MKKSFFFSAIAFLTLLFSLHHNKANAQSEDKLISELASDMCECLKKGLTGLSTQFSAMIIKVAKNNLDFEEALTDYIMKNPANSEAIKKDVGILVNFGEGKFDKCLNSFSAKYSNLNLFSNQEEYLKKLTEAIGSKDGCDLTYAFMLIGMQQKEVKNTPTPSPAPVIQ